MQSLIVFSRQRWDGVRARPQHLMARLARHWRILYVEEPVFDAGVPWAERFAPLTSVTVLRPHTPLMAPGFHDDQIPLLQKLLHQTIVREGLAHYGAWLYTPMALPLLQKLAPQVLVYDCVGTAAAGRDAPRQLVQRENALLRIANLVFTSSPSLDESLRQRHPKVHWLADGVDAAHFALARDPRRAHAEVRTLRRPRFAFCGAIDARVDLGLVAAVARLRPEFEICMIGPVDAPEATVLPHAPNLRYFGARRYEELPSWLAGMDAGLLPWVRDGSTRHGNPDPILPYLAAGKPVIATPAGDARRLYGDAVRFADTPEAFAAACDRVLVEAGAARRRREAAMQAAVSRSDWDHVADAMHALVQQESAAGLTDAAARLYRAGEPRSAPSARTLTAPVEASCLVVGAGASGLAAAWHYGAGAVLLERRAVAGGRCRSIEDSGFLFDRGGHALMSDDPGVEELRRLLLGDNVHWQECEAWTRHEGGWARDPRAGARFAYPLRGGMQSLVHGFLPLLAGELHLCAEVVRISPVLRMATLRDGRRFRYGSLVATMTVPALVAALCDEAPPEIRRLAASLRYTGLHCVNLGVRRPHLTDRHWVRFPGPALFDRVFMQGNASPHCNPPGGFGLVCEIAYGPDRPLPATGRALVDRAVAACIDEGLLKSSDPVLTANHVDVPNHRLADDPENRARLARLCGWLMKFDIVAAGPDTLDRDADVEHAFLAGRTAASTAFDLVAARRTRIA
jgi:glycosyltransferase involved in cell wall biosynthesis